VDGPPKSEPGPKKVHPRIESDAIYRIWRGDDNKLKLDRAPIVRQGGGTITYKLPSGRTIEKRTKQLIEDGCGATIEEAVAGFMRYYEQQTAGATERLQRAAEHYSYCSDQLADAKHRIEEMLREVELGARTESDEAT
jgi:hypothetical protein